MMVVTEIVDGFFAIKEQLVGIAQQDALFLVALQN